MKLRFISRRLLPAMFAFLFLLSTLLLPTTAVTPPSVPTAESVLLYCVESDTVLYARDADRIVYPAALVKLMTALVVLEAAEEKAMAPDTLFTASVNAVTIGNMGLSMAVKVGEQIALEHLLGAMLLAGAGDAAAMLAEGVFGTVDACVERMNEKAAELGMTDTVYTNPNGFHDEAMVTTANDLLLLARAAMENTTITATVSQLRVVIPATNKSASRAYGTRNYLVSNRVSQDYYLPMATGMICGSTEEAGYCVIASGQKNGLNYLAILTGADTTSVLVTPERTETDADGNSVTTPAVYKTVLNGLQEARTLLLWGESNFRYIHAVDRATPIVELPVRLGKDVDAVTALPAETIEIFAPNDIDRAKDITYTYTLTEKALTAPVKAGTEVGSLSVFYQGEFLGEVPLIIGNNIEGSGWLTFLDRVGELAATPFFLVLIVAIAAAAVFYVLSTAITRQKRRAEAKRAYDKKHRYLK